MLILKCYFFAFLSTLTSYIKKKKKTDEEHSFSKKEGLDKAT